LAASALALCLPLTACTAPAAAPSAKPSATAPSDPTAALAARLRSAADQPIWTADVRIKLWIPLR
jgi:hypothetical protein